MKNKSMYLNMMVADLDKSRAFFGGLGYTFNENFSNEDTLALQINGDQIGVMLLKREFMETFMEGHPITDTKKSNEVLIALDVESREAVDQYVDKALSLGASEHKSYDHGFMYGRDFRDLDGHIWEIFWMDESQAAE